MRAACEVGIGLRCEPTWFMDFISYAMVGKWLETTRRMRSRVLGSECHEKKSGLKNDFDIEGVAHASLAIASRRKFNIRAEISAI